MTEKEDPTFWQKVSAAWPRRKKAPWDNFAYTVADAAGESIGKGLANLAMSLVPEQKPVPIPDLQYLSPKELTTEIQRISRDIETHVPDDADFYADLIEQLYIHCGDRDPPCLDLVEALCSLASSLHCAGQFKSLSHEALKLDGLEGARARDLARAFIAAYSNVSAAHELVRNTAIRTMFAFSDRIPRIATAPIDAPPASFSVPFIDTLQHAGDLVFNLTLPLYYPDALHSPIFTSLRNRIDQNALELAKGNPDKVILPHKSDLPPKELVHGYLKATPYLNLFDVPVPFPLTSYKNHHWAIYARTGHGKSQLLQTLILEHLKEPNPPAMIILDPHRAMVDKIERLELIPRERLVVVDAQANPSPALNMFDVPKLSEEAEIEVLSLYNYIFSAIDAELTSRQDTAFSYITRLMFAVPNATIMTLLELTEEQVKTPDQSKFWPHIQQLDPVAQDYFQNRFFTPTTKQTKEQLAIRLYGVLRVRAFTRMFSATQNKLNLYQSIEEKKVVLVNTGGLGEASSIFGRYMIALSLQAAFQRNIQTEPEPALLFVDEAFDLMDANINRILTQARKYGLFLRFATQQYDQIPHDVRAAAAANTEVKLAGGLSASDARTLAGDFRTDADFLLSTKKHDKTTEFACYVQNVLDRAVKISIPFGELEKAPQISPDAFQTAAKVRRAQLAGTPAPSPEPQPEKKLPTEW